MPTTTELNRFAMVGNAHPTINRFSCVTYVKFSYPNQMRKNAGGQPKIALILRLQICDGGHCLPAGRQVPPTAQNSVMCFLIGRMKIEQENGFPARPPIPSLRKEAMGGRRACESEVSLSFPFGKVVPKV